MPELPRNLRCKLREYRFAWWCIALTETACLGAVLIAVVNPNWSPLAMLWLGWRFVTRPTNRDIAQRLAQRHPALGETITAAICFAESTDPAAVQGSPELIQTLSHEADRLIAPVPITPLLSLKPVLILIGITLALNLTLAVRRQQALAVYQSVTTKVATPSAPATAAAAARPTPRLGSNDWLAQLRQFADRLETESGDVKRSLPPYARSLKSAVDSAEQAVTAGSVGDLAQARALEQNVAEQLAEFARLARQTPALAAYAALADQLAEAFAESGQARTVPATGQSPTGETSGTRSDAPGQLPVAALPPAPSGAPWQPTVEQTRTAPAAATPPGSQGAIRDYYDKIARNK